MGTAVGDLENPKGSVAITSNTQEKDPRFELDRSGPIHDY